MSGGPGGGGEAAAKGVPGPAPGEAGATARRSTTSAAASVVIRPAGSPIGSTIPVCLLRRVIGGAMRSQRSTRTNSGPSVRPAAATAR
jgi:hypothetical protein